MSLGVKGLMQIAEKVADNTLFPVDYKFQQSSTSIVSPARKTRHNGS